MNIIEKISSKFRGRLKLLSDNIVNSAVDAARFEFGYEEASKIVIADSFETIVRILEGSFSFGRYGDGEFNIIFGKSIEFQKYSVGLSERLLAVLNSNEKNFCVGIPKFYFYPDPGLRPIQRNFVRGWVRENRDKIISLLSENNTYYDTSATQLYALRDGGNLDTYFNLMRKIWDSKKVVIVCGENSFNKVTPDLADNALHIDYIKGPSKDAFERYDDLMAKVLMHAKEAVVLISLGPTATVMAHDLHKLGYQAIDIGHAFKDYCMFKKNQTMDSVSIANYYRAD